MNRKFARNIWAHNNEYHRGNRAHNDECHWGDRADSSDGEFPNAPIYVSQPSVQGVRQASGLIQCGGCHRHIEDNSGGQGKPSCPHCWRAVNVVDSPDVVLLVDRH